MLLFSTLRKVSDIVFYLVITLKMLNLKIPHIFKIVEKNKQNIKEK